MLAELFLVFFVSFALLFMMRKVAKRVGLVDKPNVRKLHEGAIPLVGGVSICLSLVQFLVYKPEALPNSKIYLCSVLVLVGVGILDDKFDLSFKIRLFVQAALSFIMIHYAGIELNSLGNMVGFGEVELGGMTAIVTVFAVIGAINAFNMVDGIDGLLGGLSVVTFGAIAILLKVENHVSQSYFCLVIIAAMLPYIFMNLGLIGRKRKVFMGDAGSMLIGFTVIWLLLGASQKSSLNEPLMRPVTALWLIAIPLMDMAAIMYRRVRRGHSPFKPDREHLHHVFQRLGLSPIQTLVAICSLALVFAGVGVWSELNQVSESIMFYVFLVVFITYTLCLSYIWKLTSFFRRLMSKKDKVLDREKENHA